MKPVSTKAVSPSVSISTEPPIATPVVRVLKIASCPSLSGKSTLTYELGCTSDSEIQLRISANSGGGFFSPEWISLKNIEQVLEKTVKGTPITTFALRCLFAGKSVNNAGFVLSVLKHEGLVRSLENKRRCFEIADPALFVGEVNTLIDSSVNLKTDEGSATGVGHKKDASRAKTKAA